MDKERQEIRIVKVINDMIKVKGIEKGKNISDIYLYYVLLGFMKEENFIKEEINEEVINSIVMNYFKWILEL